MGADGAELVVDDPDDREGEHDSADHSGRTGEREDVVDLLATDELAGRRGRASGGTPLCTGFWTPRSP